MLIIRLYSPFSIHHSASFSIIHHPTITSYRNKPNGITTITDTLKIQRMPQSYLSHYIL